MKLFDSKLFDLHNRIISARSAERNIIYMNKKYIALVTSEDYFCKKQAILRINKKYLKYMINGENSGIRYEVAKIIDHEYLSIMLEDTSHHVKKTAEIRIMTIK